MIGNEPVRHKTEMRDALNVGVGKLSDLKPESELDYFLTALEASIDELEGAQHVLIERLDPITSKTKETSAQASNPSLDPSTEVTAKISMATGHINAIRRRVTDLLQTLAV